MARHAAVSISTVSLVVNNKGRVSDELRNRVLDAIQVLGYRPNALARSLKSRKSRVIGLVIPDIVNPFFPLMVRGVEDAAAKYGYSVVLSNSDGKTAEEIRQLRLFDEMRVDGIIYTPLGPFEEPLRALGDMAIPHVILDRRLDDYPIATVSVNNVRGAYLATSHMIRNGRKRILFLSGPPSLYAPSTDRQEGYRLALEQNGLPFTSELVVYGNLSFESGQREITAALEGGVEFDAVFAANDLMALGSMVVLAKKGFDIPGSMEVVGYDDILLASLLTPGLTTVRQPAYQMGSEAVKLVLRTIHSKQTAIASRVFEPELVIRQSSPEKMKIS